MPLRFTLRDLLWLAVVAALAVGWWLDRSRLSESEWELVQQYRKSIAGPAEVPSDTQSRLEPYVEQPSAGPPRTSR